MEPWILELIKTIGPFAALVIFFVWQGKQREERMGKRLDEQADHINQMYTTVLKDNTSALVANAEALKSNAEALRLSRETLQELIALRKQER